MRNSPLSWIFWIFSIFYVGNQVCARWDQKVHQKLQIYAEKEFLEHFLLLKTEQKSKLDQNAKRKIH